MKTVNMIYKSCLPAAMALMTLSACSDADPTPDITPAYIASGITLDIPEALQKLIYTDNTGAEVLPLVKGETVTLGCTLTPDSITSHSVQWVSSETSVATVDNGTISAISGDGLGYSVITVSPTGMYSGSGVSSTLKVKVDNRLYQATDISITSTSEEVYEGETVQLTTSITPTTATYQTVEWTSSDESVATVSSKGVVTGVKVASGTQTPVTITATALDGSGVTASYPLTVKRTVDPEDITLDQTYAAPAYACAIAEKSVTLKYATYPEDCTTSLLQWTSSDESIATVKDGVVTFNQNGNFGNVTITATCPATGKSSSIELSLPAGLIRELFHDENNYTWHNSAQSGNGTSSSHVWHDGYVTVTTYKQNATKQRGDFKCYEAKSWLCPQNYPLFAIKMDDVKDKYDACTARNINLDCSATDLTTGTKYSGNIGGGNNKWAHEYKCGDGSRVFIYDLTTQGFANGGILTAANTTQFTTLQFKYADMATLTEQVTYNVYWVQTFKTIDEITQYLDKEGISYEKIK